MAVELFMKQQSHMSGNLNPSIEQKITSSIMDQMVSYIDPESQTRDKSVLFERDQDATKTSFTMFILPFMLVPNERHWV